MDVNHAPFLPVCACLMQSRWFLFLNEGNADRFSDFVIVSLQD